LTLFLSLSTKRNEKRKQKTRLFLFLPESSSELFRPTSFANHAHVTGSFKALDSTSTTVPSRFRHSPMRVKATTFFQTSSTHNLKPLSGI